MHIGEDDAILPSDREDSDAIGTARPLAPYASALSLNCGNLPFFFHSRGKVILAAGDSLPSA